MTEQRDFPHDDASTASDAESTGQRKRPPIKRELIERWVEVTMAVLLGAVAVATAWSGYQAARWSGVQSARYNEASALRVTSTRDATLGGQEMLYDVNLFDQWLSAHEQGDARLERIYERRFRPEFVPAFEAWLATDPFNDPNAPPGPLFMPQYKVSLSEEAARLEAQASQTYAKGQAANQQSDDYVLNTVFLATVLFLVSIAERFKWIPVQSAVLLIAFALLLFGLYHLVVYAKV